MKEFGTTIRELREQKGLLLRHVAAELDIDTALLSKVERGERAIKKDQVIRLAAIIGAEKKDLIIRWLSAKIADMIENEEYAQEALKMALKRLKREN